LPDPTSPISSRCIGRSPARSSSTARIAARWSSVGRNGQAVGQPTAREPGGRRERLRPGGLAAQGATAQQRELEQQQLLEGEAAAPGLVPAEVRVGERVRPLRETLGDAQARGERLDRLAHRAGVGADQREDLRRAQPVRRRVVRHVGALVAARGRLVGRRVLLDAEGVARLELAVEDEPGAGGVLGLQPRLIEEHDLHHARAVGDGRLDERLHPPPPHGPRGDRAHLGHDGGDLARHERRDRAGLAAVAREVVEQVADRPEAERLGPLGRLRGRHLERRAEHGVRPRGVHRRVARRQRLGGGEGERDGARHRARRSWQGARVSGRAAHSAASSHQ
jgi:hypothetical protein